MIALQWSAAAFGEIALQLARTSPLPATHQLRSPSQRPFGLILSLTYARDRYVSAIQLVRGELVLLQLESVEGDETEPWPPSPAVQQIHQQQGPGGEFVAGIGMSGASHWSLSVTARTGEPSFEFDVACRAKSEAASFASTYRLRSPRRVDRTELGLAVHGGQAALLLTAEDAGEASCRAELMDDLHLRFAASNAGASYPRTVRWKYQIRALGPVD